MSNKIDITQNRNTVILMHFFIFCQWYNKIGYLYFVIFLIPVLIYLISTVFVFAICKACVIHGVNSHHMRHMRFGW